MKKRDAEEAAQLILTALDSGAEMGKMAAKWAKENFALNIREQQLLTVLHKVLDSDE
jgi:type II secretory pathway component GspD/PulD (secretin)